MKDTRNLLFAYCSEPSPDRTAAARNHETPCTVLDYRMKVALFLLLVLLSSVIEQADASQRGFAAVSGFVKKGDAWMEYIIKSPPFDIFDVWLRLDLSVVDGDTTGTVPENLQYKLLLDFRYLLPADEYAQYRDGALYLYFSRIKAGSVVQFKIGGEAADSGIIYQSAAINVEALNWKASDNWETNRLFLFREPGPVQISLDGPDHCSLQ